MAEDFRLLWARWPGWTSSFPSRLPVRFSDPPRPSGPPDGVGRGGIRSRRQHQPCQIAPRKIGTGGLTSPRWAFRREGPAFRPAAGAGGSRPARTSRRQGSGAGGASTGKGFGGRRFGRGCRARCRGGIKLRHHAEILVAPIVLHAQREHLRRRVRDRQRKLVFVRQFLREPHVLEHVLERKFGSAFAAIIAGSLRSDVPEREALFSSASTSLEPSMPAARTSASASASVCTVLAVSMLVAIFRTEASPIPPTWRIVLEVASSTGRTSSSAGFAPPT